LALKAKGHHLTPAHIFMFININRRPVGELGGARREPEVITKIIAQMNSKRLSNNPFRETIDRVRLDKDIAKLLAALQTTPLFLLIKSGGQK
jgi:hypothetical protein